jgi:hypothetical protein
MPAFAQVLALIILMIVWTPSLDTAEDRVQVGSLGVALGMEFNVLPICSDCNFSFGDGTLFSRQLNLNQSIISTRCPIFPVQI